MTEVDKQFIKNKTQQVDVLKKRYDEALSKDNVVESTLGMLESRNNLNQLQLQLEAMRNDYTRGPDVTLRYYALEKIDEALDCIDEITKSMKAAGEFNRPLLDRIERLLNSEELAPHQERCLVAFKVVDVLGGTLDEVRELFPDDFEGKGLKDGGARKVRNWRREGEKAVSANK